MAFSSSTGSGSDSISVNGLYLNFYLKEIETTGSILDKKDPELMFLRTQWMRALITEDEYQEFIDKAQAKKRIEMQTMKNYDGTELTEYEKMYIESFCVINACMKFLTYSLNIIKRDVEINADQTDDEMPGELP
jgi:hypothetical protein